MRKILVVLILVGFGVVQASGTWGVFNHMLRSVEGVEVDCPEDWRPAGPLPDEITVYCAETYMGFGEFREAIRELRPTWLDPLSAWRDAGFGYGQSNRVRIDRTVSLYFLQDWFGERSSLVVWWVSLSRE